MKLALCLALLIGATAVAQPHDVEGWGKTRWGMTTPQLRKLFPTAKIEKDGLELVGFDVAGVTCRVFMSLDKNRKLEKVALIPDAPTHRSAEELFSGLSEKYGRPISPVEHKWTWTFTTTTISLTALFVGDAEPGMVFLIYQRPGSAQPNL